MPAKPWPAEAGTGIAPSTFRRGYPKQIVGRHLLFFRGLAEGGVEIVRVLHQRMDVEQHS